MIYRTLSIDEYRLKCLAYDRPYPDAPVGGDDVHEADLGEWPQGLYSHLQRRHHSEHYQEEKITPYAMTHTEKATVITECECFDMSDAYTHVMCCVNRAF